MKRSIFFAKIKTVRALWLILYQMNVVIDTNILIESTADEFSYPKRIIDEVLSGNIEAYGTNPIIRENQLLLEEIVPNENQRQFLEDYFARIIEVPVRFNHQVIDMDPEDDKFINAALSAAAEYIITNDDHLLQHDGYEGIQIKKPDDFWFSYKGEDEDTARKEMLDLMGL